MKCVETFKAVIHDFFINWGQGWTDNPADWAYSMLSNMSVFICFTQINKLVVQWPIGLKLAQPHLQTPPTLGSVLACSVSDQPALVQTLCEEESKERDELISVESAVSRAAFKTCVMSQGTQETH